MLNQHKFNANLSKIALNSAESTPMQKINANNLPEVHKCLVEIEAPFKLLFLDKQKSM